MKADGKSATSVKNINKNEAEQVKHERLSLARLYFTLKQ